MEDDNSSEGDGEYSVQTVVAICISTKILAFAVFNETLNEIAADKIAVSTLDMEETLLKIKTLFSPSLFLIHPKIFTNKGLLDLVLSAVDGSPNFYRYKATKSSCWNAELASDVIFNKLIVKESSGKECMNNFLWISSIIDMECMQLRQALGALVVYMQTNSFNFDEGVVTVSRIRGVPLNSYMKLDDGSFRYVNE